MTLERDAAIRLAAEAEHKLKGAEAAARMIQHVLDGVIAERDELRAPVGVVGYLRHGEYFPAHQIDLAVWPEAGPLYGELNHGLHLRSIR